MVSRDHHLSQLYQIHAEDAIRNPFGKTDCFAIRPRRQAPWAFLIVPRLPLTLTAVRWELLLNFLWGGAAQSP
jgi:hypothetical protein